jgi:hypothetical protein
MLEAQHEIVGEADLRSNTPQSGLHFVLEPFVKHVM